MDLVSVAWSYAKRRRPSYSEPSLFQTRGRPDVEEAKERGKSSGDPETVATGNIAERVASTILARPLTPEERHREGQIVHYGYGATLGLVYGWSAARFPFIRSGHGVLYSVAVGLGGFGVLLTAPGLSRPSQQYSVAQHAPSILSHAAYGATLDSPCEFIDAPVQTIDHCGHIPTAMVTFTRKLASSDINGARRVDARPYQCSSSCQSRSSQIRRVSGAPPRQHNGFGLY